MARDELGGEEYWVPECVRSYLRAAGYSTRALEDIDRKSTRLNSSH